MLDERKNRFNALVDTKSLSIIRIDGNNKKMPTHYSMTQYLLKNYLVAREIAERFVKKLSSEKISELLNEYSEEILDSRRRNLIYRYLVRKLDMLQGLLEEAESNENK